MMHLRELGTKMARIAGFLHRNLAFYKRLGLETIRGYTVAPFFQVGRVKTFFLAAWYFTTLPA